ncbi:MAG TPA: hypothetical protein VNG33_14655 [Polyangiaceae bacterium]|nr:hypothetical protein [Polyangiaceae bacterium]
MQVFDDVAMLKVDQDAEYMLCEACERIIKVGEDYAADVSLQVDGSFPARNACVVERHDGEDCIADASALDIDKLAHFAAGVVWRASVSTTLKHYDDIDLGKYNVQFAQYLSGKAGFPANARLMIELLDPKIGPRIHGVVIKPEVQKFGGYRVFHFCVFGIMFRIQLGNALPKSTIVSSILDNKKIYISDGSRVLGAVAKRAHAVTPKGSLARKL